MVLGRRLDSLESLSSAINLVSCPVSIATTCSMSVLPAVSFAHMMATTVLSALLVVAIVCAPVTLTAIAMPISFA